MFGDNVYGTGEFQQFFEDAEIDLRWTTLSSTAPGGLFPKERFTIDLTTGAALCQASLPIGSLIVLIMGFTHREETL